MPAPISQNEPTGSPKLLAAIVIILLVLGGTLLYAARLPVKNAAPPKRDTPQVEGVTTEDAPLQEPSTADNDPPPDAEVLDTYFKITATVDGDTVRADMNGKIETIRLIGVDTPETKDPRKSVQCFGRQATDFTNVSLTGKTVRLAADDSQDNRDKYGRLLRYIFLQDGTNFNGRLIAEGFAYEYTYDIPYIYQQEFKAYQSDAEAAQKGLWSPATCSGKR